MDIKINNFKGPVKSVCYFKMKIPGIVFALIYNGLLLNKKTFA